MPRRAFLAGTGSAALATGVGAVVPAVRERSRPPSGGGFAEFRWLGTAGWDVRTPTTRLLVDPYLSRFPTGLAAGRFDTTTPLRLDEDAVAAALGPPGTGASAVRAVLVTHTHWDHFADVPHIAATHGATVFTTLTGYHLCQSWGVPAQQLAPVRGGEELRLGDLVVRAVPSLHSRSASGGLLFPGVRTTVPEPPSAIADLPEGDTLAYLLRSPAGRRVLLMGASDFDDQALRGLEPDVVALPVPSNDVTADYVERLMAALDSPRTVVPVHWDDFESPLTNPPRALNDDTARRLAAMTSDVTRLSPRTRVVAPTYFQPLWLL